MLPICERFPLIILTIYPIFSLSFGNSSGSLMYEKVYFSLEVKDSREDFSSLYRSS